MRRGAEFGLRLSAEIAPRPRLCGVLKPRVRIAFALPDTGSRPAGRKIDTDRSEPFSRTLNGIQHRGDPAEGLR